VKVKSGSERPIGTAATVTGMSNRDRIERFLRSTLRGAGRTVGEAERAYRSARQASDVPTDEHGRARIVCRRYAEKRAVQLDEAARPACFDADHPACEGCVEDIREGRIETW